MNYDIEITPEAVAAAGAVYGEQIPAGVVETMLSTALDHVKVTFAGQRPIIPGVSTGKDNEEMYRLEAARMIQVAATDLIRVAERLDRYAESLAAFDGTTRRAFPHAGYVRDALNEFRNSATVIMRLDSALENAMLADHARAAAVGG